MKITVVQPPYYIGENPDEKIADFLTCELNKTETNSLIVLPEYSNAGGVSDKESIKKAINRASEMLKTASNVALEKSSYVAINVLEERKGKIRNSTYLFDKTGKTAFIYDKTHLPPAEVSFGIDSGNGDCISEIDGIRFGFLTCYDIYFNEQIEYLASKKPDIIIFPVYQRGEDSEIIRAQTKLLAFRCNSFVARSSFSMGTDEKGGQSMIVSPNGKILENSGKEIGSISWEINPQEKYMRPSGFGGKDIRNDDFINQGLRPDIFKK